MQRYQVKQHSRQYRDHPVGGCVRLWRRSPNLISQNIW